MSDAKSGLELTLDEAAKTVLLEAQWRSETGGGGASPFTLHLKCPLGFPDSSIGKECACSARDPGLIPRVRKISWRKDMLPTPVFLGFPCGSAGIESTCNVEDWVRSLNWEDPLEKG